MYQYPFSKHFLFYFSSFSCRPCHTATKHSFSISIHSPLASFSKLIRSIKRIFIWYTKTYTGRRNTNMGRNCQTVLLIYCFCFMSPSQRNTHGKHCHAVYQRWRSCQLLLHDSISAYIF